MAGDDESTDEDQLRRWVEAVTEGRISSWRRTPAGGSRETYLVDVTSADGRSLPLVLRMESGGAFTGTEINVSKEATVYRALAGSGVPVPGVVGVAPGGAALLMERVPGTGDLADLSEDERHEVLAEFVEVVADLHNLDAAGLHLPGFARPRTPEEHATLDLRLWSDLAERGVPDLDPLVRYAGAHLRHHPPDSVARTVLVQGDTGPGNFVTDHGRITALVDMEFAHLGDPMDDLAWMLMRTAPIGVDLARHFDRYSERTGIPVLPRSLAYYEVAVQYRCAVTTSLAVARGGGARGWAPYLLVTQRYIRGMAEALCSCLGAELPAVPTPEVTPTGRAPYYEALLEGVRAAVKGIDDPRLREETRNLQIFVHHLRAIDRFGSELADQDRRDRGDTLGIADDDRSLASAAEEGGRSADREVLGYLLRRARRNEVLWASLLDRPRR
ncbi:MAG TPA: phosphotransferase family protein [Acidimicrobiales bacterium]|nr:phosphotransferase family protein [Acidimicrobiales bacterium]